MNKANPNARPKDWLEQAVSLHEAGRFDDAKVLYHKVLGVYPGHAGTLHMLGLAEMQSGQHKAAIAQLKKAVAAEPDNASYQGNLGVAYKSAGDNEGAIATYKKALALDPSLAPLHNNLGVAFQDLGDHSGARDSFRKALALNARYPEAETNLGISLVRLGDTENGIKHFRRALMLNPDYAKAHAQLGLAYWQSGLVLAAIESLQAACRLQPSATLFVQMGELCFENDWFEQSIGAFSEALALEPDNLDILTHLARAEAKRGQLEQAEHLYNAAIEGGDKRPVTHFALGGVLLDLGRRDEAVQHYRQAVQADVDFAPAHRMIAFATRHTGESDDIAAIRAAHDRVPPQSEARMHLGFALGKVEEDLGRHTQAFAYFTDANRLRRKAISYDAYQTRLRAEAIMRLFDADLFDRHRGSGAEGEGPLFILGMPRSGTSLTEQILAAHPDVHGAGELRLLSAMMVEAGLADPETMFSEAIRDFPAERFAELGRTYLSRTTHLASHARYISNKMPGNFWRIGLIKLMLPGARIVHCRRNPADNCLSIFKNYFSVDGHHYAYDLEELGAYYATYQRLMHHWHKVLPGFIYDLDYEAMVAGQEGESRKLLNWLGLDWDDAVLNFHESGRVVKTASAEQVRRPIYADSVNLSARYGEALKPLLDALNTQN